MLPLRYLWALWEMLGMGLVMRYRLLCDRRLFCNGLECLLFLIRVIPSMRRIRNIGFSSGGLGWWL